MPSVHLLGTGAAISDPHRTTTMIAVSEDEPPYRTLVVDCGGDVLQRLQACDRPIDSVDGLIVTHAHMDHTSGFPLLMEKVWLDGRNRALPVFGIEPALAQAGRLWEAFEPVHHDWEGIPPIDWREIEHAPDTPVWPDAPWTVIATPVNHGDTPNVGLRIEHDPTGHVLGYSCDTAPTDNVVDLAQDCNILIHEANGVPGGNHSTAVEAAEAARDADANRLLLVHLPPGDKSAEIADARAVFPNTDPADELGTYPF
ncbi:MAG: MBL fold metallo-hydrolase [Bacteroidetes bacterium SW_9_63_38]|nr:MAG: MBL fold metallo-hydrolase [Bacteroidetes bacterium SW_9_63_38]